MKTVDEYISELKNGNKIRIIYNRMIHDYIGGGWTQELWSYDNNNTDKQYVCEYPISTYKNGFCTTHTLEQTMSSIQESIDDLTTNSCDSEYVVAIKIEVEYGDDSDTQSSLEEKYLNQMRKLECETDHDEADYLLCRLLEELGFTELVKVYRELPKWYS